MRRGRELRRAIDEATADNVLCIFHPRHRGSGSGGSVAINFWLVQVSSPSCPYSTPFRASGVLLAVSRRKEEFSVFFKVTSRRYGRALCDTGYFTGAFSADAFANYAMRITRP